MRKLALLALAAVSVMATAGVNLNIDNPVETVNLPPSGYVDVMFTGTVDVLAGWTASGATVYWPGDGTNFLAAYFAPSFINYFSIATPGLDYTGDLFYVTVNSTDLPGFYDINGSSTTGCSELIVSATKNGRTFSDNEYYAVEVLPVPEPASIAVLGLGAAALLRRRNRR